MSEPPAEPPAELPPVEAVQDAAFFDGLRDFFERGIPFHETLGLRVVSVSRGACELLVPPSPRLVGDPYRPALHGGVISTLADTAGGLAVFSGAEPGDRVSTVDLRVDYLRPGQIDQPLRARARLVRLGNRVGMAEVVLFHEEPERPVAKAAGVYSVLRREGGAR